MSIKSLIKEHTETDKILGTIKTTIQKSGQNKQNFTDIKGTQIKVEDIYMAMVSQIRSTSEVLEEDYQHLLAEAILILIKNDPCFHEGSFEEMVSLIRRRTILKQ
ncbi:MAG: hypothetical protein COA44_09485 [Arcobacter sp.]|nr:MAG: hypothetical protein COA44_09485 [Arcobacter sp.]